MPLIDLASICKYWALWSNLAVCHFFATFGVSQAKSDRPIKTLENTNPLAFTQIEEEPIKYNVTPSVMGEMMQDQDASRTSRVMAAVLRMDKLDITELKRAYDGGAV